MSRENNTPSKKNVKPLSADQIEQKNKTAKFVKLLDKGGAHWVLADADKRPIQKAWIKNPPTKAALSAHFKAGGLLGLIPASIGCCVIDIDETKDPKLLNELATTADAWHKTRREGGHHYWYRCEAAPKGNKELHWKGAKVGDYRYNKGFIVLWNPKAVAPLIEMDTSDTLPEIVRQLRANKKAGTPGKRKATDAADWTEGARNETLNRMAFAAGKAFGNAKNDTERTAATRRLDTAKASAAAAGLPAAELGTTAQSGWNAGQQAAAAERGTGKKAAEAAAAIAELEQHPLPEGYPLPDVIYKDSGAIEWRALNTLRNLGARLGFRPRLETWTAADHSGKPTMPGLFKTEIDGEAYTAELTAALEKFNPEAVKAGKERIRDSWRHNARTHPFNAWKEWAADLPADISEAFDYAEYLADVLGLENDPATLSLLRVFALGAWNRANHPGSQHDYMLVLSGASGCGKSTAVRWLAVFPEWWSASVPLADNDPGNLIYAMRGRWIMESGEMGRLRQYDQRTVKHNISNPIDKARLKYERTETTYRRQGVFIGTTDTAEYLADYDSTRRYHIVQIVRPMKWAEMTARTVRMFWAAVKRDYESGARAADHLTIEVKAAAHERATAATAELPFVEELETLLTERAWWGTEQKTDEIYRGLFESPGLYADYRDKKHKHKRAVATALRVLGCEHRHTGTLRVWVIPAKAE